MLPRNALRPHVLFGGEPEVGATFNRRLVCNEHAKALLHQTNAGYDARSRRQVLIDAIAGQRPYLKKRRSGVQHRVDPVPRKKLTRLLMSLPGLLLAAGARSLPFSMQFRDKTPKMSVAPPELFGGGRDGRRNCSHWNPDPGREVST